MPQARAYFVESIPLGMEELRRTEGVDYTEFALKRLVDAAAEQIDVAAMYWNLLPDPDRVDERGFSEEQFAEMGADSGRNLFAALEEAAGRGVKIRILQSPGFSAPPHESDQLAEGFPGRVELRTLNMSDWYAGGIMHQKMWLFDQKHVYLGSANNDWKSITQVKELGIVVEDHPEVVEDFSKLFESFWRICHVEPSTAVVMDAAVGVERTVPGWSPLLLHPTEPPALLTDNNLDTSFNAGSTMRADLNGEAGELFITSSPPEFCTTNRTTDLEGLLQTIEGATSSICVSVMNFMMVSSRGKLNEENGLRMIGEEAATPIWWSVLADALLRAAVTRGVHVRLLVSNWAYSPASSEAFLKALQAMSEASRQDPTMKPGRLEVRMFEVPGWETVLDPEKRYPGHSRVNHPKYMVTDRQANIGTSNLSWSYFANTAGASFNCTHRSLVDKLQEIFDRDWDSAYARTLK